jgi:ribosomal protein S18 acetylase RimI-like enzyme
VAQGNSRESEQVSKPPTYNVEVRPIKRDDEVRECAELMASSEPWITLERTLEQATSILTSPTREVYVGEVDGEMVGFAVLIMRGAFVGFLQTLAVKPSWRNRGIGTSMMRFVEQRILRDTPNVFLCVSSFNDGAQRFYRRLGYEVVGELRDLIVPGHSEILMRKTTGPYTGFSRESTPVKR